MRMKHVLSAGFGALALSFLATTAQAAPAAGLGSVADATAIDTSLVEKAHWYGRRYYYDDDYPYYYYRRHYRPYYGYYYYPRHYYHRHYYRYWY